MKHIILLIVIILFTSCMGMKSVSEKNNSIKETESVIKAKDSTTTSNTNKEINDVVTVEVPVSDPEVDKKIDEILSKLNVQKSSGGNSYKLNYDKIKRELKAELIIAETKDIETNVNSAETTVKSFEEKTDEYLKKKITAIPWWLYLIAVIVFLPKIIRFASNFFPALKAVKIFSSFFT